MTCSRARPGNPESLLTQRDMDLARSVQEVTEEVMLRLARTLRRETGARNLCLAGGVALNCVGNGQDSSQWTFQRPLDSTFGGRRRGRRRSRANRVAPTRGQRSNPGRLYRCHAGQPLGSLLYERRSRGVPQGKRRAVYIMLNDEILLVLLSMGGAITSSEQ